ncbi:MAG: SMI1/KNR4 family protein [Oscillospiraceae bacterium]|nr:SMI1/KNR4 family protein [Oscillospiraceae bacterium]
MDFVTEVKSLAVKARERDTKFHRFGALGHRYEFNPPILIDKVHEFEAASGLTLPEAYVLYLTQIGNGGAGPDYGLFPLEKIKAIYDPNEEIFLDKKDYDEEWVEICRAYDESLENDDGEYLRIESRAFNGSVIIGTPGCTMYTILMCKGENYGKIGVIDSDMVEEYVPQISDKTFEEWILEYFRKAAEG